MVLACTTTGPFKCEVPGCDYAASRSGHLKRHMRVHIADAAAVPADFTGTGLEAEHDRVGPVGGHVIKRKAQAQAGSQQLLFQCIYLAHVSGDG